MDAITIGTLGTERGTNPIMPDIDANHPVPSGFSRNASTVSSSKPIILNSKTYLKPSFSHTRTEAIFALSGHTTNRFKPTTANAYSTHACAASVAYPWCQ
jgi:hypothetical protein